MSKVVWVYITVFLVILLVVYLQSVYDRKHRKKLFYFRIKDQWGKASEREYTLEEMDKLTQYFYLKERTTEDKSALIDDITWHDLDMDRLFRQMNQTCSSIGEEYLYNLLRTLVFDEEELKRRDELMGFFEGHADERMFLQEIFGNIGRVRRVSVIGYLTEFEDLQVKGPWRYYLHQFLLLASIVLLFVIPPVGLFMTILSLGWNVTSYYAEKREINVYLDAFSYICNVLNKAELFEKVKAPLLKPYVKDILENVRKLRAFRKGRKWLKSGSDLSGGFSDMIMDYVRILFHVDLQQFNKMLKELMKHKQDLLELYEQLGYLESMISAASYRAFLDSYAVPELSFDVEAGVCAKEMYHPLIMEPVANSIESKRGVLLTGSNASGKSTFLKTMAVNGILAQTIYTVAAKSFSMPRSRIYSSMALQDNLESEESYYIVEIKSLKRIVDACKRSGASSDTAVLCFVDEVLRGTNTVERIAASTEILNSLARTGVYCFAATHDIELTYLLENEYGNYHFSEKVMDGQVLFDYELREGRAVTRNAIRLLEVMGYEPWIIENAQARAQHFLKEGNWQM